MDPHDFHVVATIVDTKTGLTSTMESTVYQLTYGNDSCDCNRERSFDCYTCNGTCLGCERYRVIEVSTMPEGYTLADFNEGYQELS